MTIAGSQAASPGRRHCSIDQSERLRPGGGKCCEIAGTRLPGGALPGISPATLVWLREGPGAACFLPSLTKSLCSGAPGREGRACCACIRMRRRAAFRGAPSA